MTYYQLEAQRVVGIPLYKNGEIVEFALVDLEDAHKVLSISNKWKVNTQGYAYCRKGSEPNRVTVLMHRVILDNPENMVDHINRNRIDNRRGNLRPATAAQNFLNRERPTDKTSGFIGVQKQSANRFIARIGVNKQRVYLGGYRTAEEAARVYDAAARKYHGGFAPLNFPD